MVSTGTMEWAGSELKIRPLCMVRIFYYIALHGSRLKALEFDGAGVSICPACMATGLALSCPMRSAALRLPCFASRSFARCTLRYVDSRSCRIRAGFATSAGSHQRVVFWGTPEVAINAWECGVQGSLQSPLHL